MNWTQETSNSEYGKSKYLAEMEVWRGMGEGLNVVMVNPVIILEVEIGPRVHQPYLNLHTTNFLGLLRK
jgi:nucleoside-diphosphate-sugar epimerase